MENINSASYLQYFSHIAPLWKSSLLSTFPLQKLTQNGFFKKSSKMLLFFCPWAPRWVPTAQNLAQQHLKCLPKRAQNCSKITLGAPLGAWGLPREDFGVPPASQSTENHQKSTKKTTPTTTKMPHTKRSSARKILQKGPPEISR